MTPGRDSWGTTRREPLTRIRRAIADAMARSASTIPQVTDTDDADVTELDRLRQGYHSDEKPGRKLTLLPFAVRAVVLALKKHPILNASLDADAGAIVFHDYISIAVGVQTDRGLVAPVIRAAGDLSVVQITDELAMLAAKARAASFEVNDTRGGTFTISNAGAMGGSRYSTPIINPPQAAILALGRARWMPRVVGGPGGMIAPRLILPLSLSFDHRIIDGGVSVPFMQEIIAALEHPARLML
jgi:pyruvate dehydrogenase E2 component (dihydrolipoamide acetyltransferase)